MTRGLLWQVVFFFGLRRVGRLGCEPPAGSPCLGYALGMDRRRQAWMHGLLATLLVGLWSGGFWGASACSTRGADAKVVCPMRSSGVRAAVLSVVEHQGGSPARGCCPSRIGVDPRAVSSGAADHLRPACCCRKSSRDAPIGLVLCWSADVALSRVVSVAGCFPRIISRDAAGGEHPGAALRSTGSRGHPLRGPPVFS